MSKIIIKQDNTVKHLANRNINTNEVIDDSNSRKVFSAAKHCYMLNPNKKILSIKTLRTATGLGLKEAKELVEYFLDMMKKDQFLTVEIHVIEPVTEYSSDNNGYAVVSTPLSSQ